jgi:cyclophilin family peptidyl-prolyl cis-trans isomerase
MIASMAAVGFSAGQSQTPEPPPIIDVTITPAATSQAVNFASPAPVIDATKPYQATIKTNEGDIVIDLATDTPQTVNSLAFLAAKNFYDNQAFFYVDHNYVAQVGDPVCNPELQQICTGTGDAGYRVPTETGSLEHTKWNVVAPSIQGSDNEVSGGQFRILFADDHRLDGTETVFGTVVSGQDVLENAPNFLLCSALTQQSANCAKDLSGALVIEDVTVTPKS